MEKFDMAGLLQKSFGSETIRQPATTLNLFPNAENSSDALGEVGAFAYSKSWDAIPDQHAAFGSANFNEEITGKADLRNSRPQTVQMTILHGEQVLDSFPAEKAKENVELAKKLTSSGSNVFPATSTINPTNSGASESNNVLEQLQLQPLATAYLPIARRNSLRQFLEKRKERAAARAPYQINKHSDVAPPSRGEESAPWNDQEALSPRHLELRLSLN